MHAPYSTLARGSTLMMRMSSKGLSVLGWVLHFSMDTTTSMPLTTRPNTVCLPSSQGVAAVVMKNCPCGG